MPPEPNPDGSYTFSLQEIENLCSYFEALKQPDITQEARLQYVQEAQAHLPTEQQQQQHADKFESLIQKQILEHEARYYPPTPPQKPEPPSPELVALEKALKERYEKDLERLQQSHRRDLKNHLSTGDTYALVSDRCKTELARLKTTYETDLKRYTQEHQDAQKLLKELSRQ